MTLMAIYPKIRDVHPIPYEQNGNPAFLLRDPLQLNGHMLVIPEAIAPLLYIADGTRNTGVLATILNYHYGLQISEKEVADILSIFDDAFLIDNDRSREAHAAALAEYRKAEYRLPASAGGSYPADPAKLHQLIQDFLEHAETEPDIRPVAGILSPHIDFDRGGDTYALVWKRASAALQEADLIIIIGTDHYSGKDGITLTRQHFATPFGVLPTDQDAVNLLANSIGQEQVFSGELFHKTEHSIELPLVWLHHVIGGKEVSILPILCGNLDPEDDWFERFIEALKTISATRKTFTLISGDLAHVGPAFGGDPVSENGRARIHKSDTALLDHLVSGDSEGFLRQIRAIDNANNVCGTFPLYLAMQAFGFTSGDVHGYQQCPADEAMTSIVSIGGIVFR